MSLRAIKALAMPDLTPATITDPVPEIRWVRPEVLLVDEKYQRDLSERSIKLIRRIVSDWDWASFTPPKAVEVDGKLHVTDGQPGHGEGATAMTPAIINAICHDALVFTILPFGGLLAIIGAVGCWLDLRGNL